MAGLPRTRDVLEQAVRDRVFPGAIVQTGGLARDVRVEAVGAFSYDAGSPEVGPDTVYDIASLTKVLCTTTLAAGLVAEGRLGLDDSIAQWCRAWSGADRAEVTLRHLLLHASGLPAHRRYFESLAGGDAFERAIAAEPLEYTPGARSVYSDPGFILLGRIVARAGGGDLDALFDGWWRRQIGGDPEARFNPPAEWRSRITPTEFDPWRGRLLVGEVHDENAAALGGVAGHAGLFGTAAAVARCAAWWMRQTTREPWSQFVRRGEVAGSSRALGWDTMLPSSSCGSRMSPAAFGHTGFTGTSLWIDPEQDCYVVLLSNRVHPSRAGDAMSRVRPAVHDAVAEDLTRG